jgi:hypothetical protein
VLSSNNPFSSSNHTESHGNELSSSSSATDAPDSNSVSSRKDITDNFNGIEEKDQSGSSSSSKETAKAAATVSTNKRPDTHTAKASATAAPINALSPRVKRPDAPDKPSIRPVKEVPGNPSTLLNHNTNLETL